MNGKEQLMKKLQEVDFALTELGLYLDSHPDCAKALTSFREKQEQSAALSAEYEQGFGPLVAGGGGNTDYWDWAATPFPWENC